MLPYRDSRLTKIALAAFFLIVVAYAYYEGRGMLFGPRITVPSEVIEVSERFIVIRGKADRIASLSMNGTPIAVTEDGAFEEPYLLAPGLNRVAFDATDKYGRTTYETVRIVYMPGTSEVGATSTPATSTTTESPVPLEPAS
jgi:hypothetical protein